MAEILSPLEPVYRRGTFGNVQAGGAGVLLSETRPGSIVELTAWRGEETAMRAVIAAATGLEIEDRPGAGALSSLRAAFLFAPGRWLLVDQAEGLCDVLAQKVGIETGTVTDLSHGRIAIAIRGGKAEWVLSKLYAIDFSPDAFPEKTALASAHREFLTLIQRTTAHDGFDLYVYRSFARSFWQLLTTSAHEVGYTVE